MLNAQELGAAIRLNRENAGASIAVAAAELGVSVQFLFDLESGKPSIQFDKALSVASAVGINLVPVDNPAGQSLFARRVARRKQTLRMDRLADFHRAVAKQLRDATPRKRKDLIAQARKETDRWEAQRLCHPNYIEGWRTVLDNGPDALIREVVEDPVNGAAMMQNTPFGFLKTRGRR